ncbi:MAG: SUMF1/EgtB/PvdO family nonheme iron enzyme [Prevotellaceae bacterium]|jgi:formylglycine-generating enzyme required for sulfatase activity|nr:SUMF1/EgtB/PvdO family nonheme iron enzyme [Prevotellaceae bacterium]
MKKAAFLLVALVCGIATFGQDKTVAVVPATGESVSQDIRIGISNGLEEGVFNSGQYTLVARGADFEMALSELIFQQSGAVSDNQLTKFGYAVRADLVCYATVSKYSNREYRISYKMIDVASSKIVNIGSETVRDGASGLLTATNNITTKLFSGKSGDDGHSRRHPAEPEVVYVQGGIFTMGCTYEQGNGCDDDEKPAHSVTVSSFHIGKYEVTQAQWKAIMGVSPNGFQDDNLPVERVSWEDTQEFISRLNAATGKHYRLPTEAEWEYAARGGKFSRNYKYSGSNSVDEVAWYTSNTGIRTSPVGTKKSNELGIFDMSGNVLEWCSDWYGSYSASSQQNPVGASSGSYRILRGGNWLSIASNCRVAAREHSTPSDRYDVGFRVVLP